MGNSCMQEEFEDTRVILILQVVHRLVEDSQVAQFSSHLKHRSLSWRNPGPQRSQVEFTAERSRPGWQEVQVMLVPEQDLHFSSHL